jgi:hypothetical protein
MAPIGGLFLVAFKDRSGQLGLMKRSFAFWMLEE